MEPYLTASGIDFSRNQPEMPLWKIINDANGQDYNLHLAIHSNASPDAQAGKNTGVQIYYYPTSERGKRFAEIIAENYRPIYREPMNIKLVPNANLAELRKTKAPAVLIETAYHDNRADARPALSRNPSRSTSTCRLRSRKITSASCARSFFAL